MNLDDLKKDIEESEAFYKTTWGKIVYVLYTPIRFWHNHDWKEFIVYPFQRVYRGWDNRAVWGVDEWLCDKMTPILKQLKIKKRGYPACLNSADEWSKILDQIILGFESYKKIVDMSWVKVEDVGTQPYKDKMAQLEHDYRVGMSYFRDYLGALWD